MNYTSSAQSIGVTALPPWRSRLLYLMLLFGLFLLFAYGVYLQCIHNTFLQQKGDERFVRTLGVVAHRGTISDRNGEPLAISTPVESVWASPQKTEATPRQIRSLAQALSMSANEVAARLSDTEREFVYLKRQLPPDQAEKVMKLGIPGVALQREYRRYYPDGEVSAQLLGFTDVDDNGREGMELALQQQVGGENGSQRVIKDNRGRVVERVASLRLPKPGSDVVLSIDKKLQTLAYREIKLAVEQHHAKSGSIVVLDAKTGEVLALGNWPSFNPNNRGKPAAELLRNSAVIDQFEPGSTMKPFTVAAALEAGKVKPETVINTSGGALTIGDYTIHDSHPDARLTVAQVIQKSSNVGAAKMALSLAPEIFWRNLNESGFGETTGCGFPGEAPGRLRDYKTWRPIEQATMSYGNGISVNLLQLARAYTVFANDGELLPVSLLKLDAPPGGKRIYTANTARAVRSMMELVVQPGGTAPLAQVSGYRVAGKTGTAHKLDHGRYVDHYVSSFVGLAPASSPRLIIAVKIDDPQDGQYYGGQIAAPVFSTVMGAALHMFNVPNDAPLDNVAKPSGEIVREET
ncbi:MAG TPA: penicillin-binding protein 2 [Gallionellaceae bacterium]